MYDQATNLFFKSIDLLYKWLNDNLLSHVLTFTKEFGTVIIFISAIIFLLIAIYLVMKQARRLPKLYIIYVYDANDDPITILDLRVTFTTFEAAASYSQFYTRLYGDRYKFKLHGVKSDNLILKRYG